MTSPSSEPSVSGSSNYISGDGGTSGSPLSSNKSSPLLQRQGSVHRWSPGRWAFLAGRSPGRGPPSRGEQRLTLTSLLTLLIAVGVALCAAWQLSQMLRSTPKVCGKQQSVTPMVIETKHLQTELESKQRNIAALKARVAALQESEYNPKWVAKPARQKIRAFVGVMTGYGYPHEENTTFVARREALRDTWFPSNKQALQQMEDEFGVVACFVIGRAPLATAPASAAAADEQRIDAEEEQFGGFFRINMTDVYESKVHKLLVYLKAVVAAYDAEYILKVDDEMFLRLDRLPYAIRDWSIRKADYVGCMKTWGQVVSDYNSRWYEPAHRILGPFYYVHASGSNFAISGSFASQLDAMDDGMLRYFSAEDVTVGAWMLAFNATHYDEGRLCQGNCNNHTVGVWALVTNAPCAVKPCADLPTAMRATWGDPACRTPASELVPPSPDDDWLRAVPVQEAKAWAEEEDRRRQAEEEKEMMGKATEQVAEEKRLNKEKDAARVRLGEAPAGPRGIKKLLRWFFRARSG